MVMFFCGFFSRRYTAYPRSRLLSVNAKSATVLYHGLLFVASDGKGGLAFVVSFPGRNADQLIRLDDVARQVVAVDATCVQSDGFL